MALRFFLPPPDLQPYLTTLYHLEVTGAGPQPVEDRLHPEWANLRIIASGSMTAGIGTAALEPLPPAVLVGPTSVTTRFAAANGCSWGIGILPLGWGRMFAFDARDLADRLINPADQLETSHLAPLCRAPAEAGGTLENQYAAMVEEVRKLVARPAPREADIVRMQQALVDPQFGNSAELARELGMSVRTMERFSARFFGFSPQLLLRRQRFLRSLARFMLDPSLKWIDSLDTHYHDQAHFVRDFRRFMAMSPSQYARIDHPVLDAAVRARTAIAGEAMQVLHKPLHKPLPA